MAGRREVVLGRVTSEERFLIFAAAAREGVSVCRWLGRLAARSARAELITAPSEAAAQVEPPCDGRQPMDGSREP